MKKVVCISIATMLGVTSFISPVEGAKETHVKSVSSKSQADELVTRVLPKDSPRWSLNNDSSEMKNGTCWFNTAMQCLCSSVLLREQLDAIDDLWTKSGVTHDTPLLCSQLKELFLLMEKRNPLPQNNKEVSKEALKSQNNEKRLLRPFYIIAMTIQIFILP